MPVELWGDADGSLYRSSYFEMYPGRLAPGRLDPLLRARQLRRHRPLRRDAQPRRRPPRHRRVLQRRRGAAGGHGQPRRPPRGRRGRRGRAAAVRRARRRRRAGRRAARQHRPAPAPRPLAAPRARPIRAVPAIPRTLTGKKLEAPVKRILRGVPAEVVASRDSLLDPTALDPFVAIAGREPFVGRGRASQLRCGRGDARSDAELLEVARRPPHLSTRRAACMRDPESSRSRSGSPMHRRDVGVDAVLDAGGPCRLEALDRSRCDAFHEDAAQELQACGVARRPGRRLRRASRAAGRSRRSARRPLPTPAPASPDRGSGRLRSRRRLRTETGSAAASSRLSCGRRRVQIGVERIRRQARRRRRLGGIEGDCRRRRC